MSETTRISVVVGSKNGLHARPAARVVEFCRGLSSPVTLGKPDGPQINPKSLVTLLTLDANCGETLLVESVDPKAASALAALIAQELDREDVVT